ncbi:MAG: TDT family transporter [Clostridium sp.]|uniref:TDT family transporter n=1 Tax=Clostridium sp. TaxID=1506 RepID=UPI0025C14EF9|nr:TDT family transporter [Clostridium sp.]MCF0148091.1 TDT family transporter [Clostridium sp.]
MKNNLLKKIENIPVPLLPTMVGAATLSNVYSTLGYSFVRHITMWVTTIILLTYLVKIIAFSDTCKKEYSNTVPASLYAGFTMITMILGSYYFDYNNILGKTLWFIGVILHAIHILIFTYRNVFKGVNKDTFVPSWFVTYNGIMVSVVIGASMKEPLINKIVLYYGISALIVIMPFMILRLIKLPLKDALYHTQAILLAPSSLCLVSYFNVIENPNKIVVYLLYILVFATLVFILYKLPKFFSFEFYPGFAGLTFPMAIGIVASTKMSGFLISNGNEYLGNIVKQISGIQIYVTTAIISYVLFNFFKMFLKAIKTK